MKIIKIDYLTYYFIIIFFISGYIKNALIIFFIVFVHEMGHFFVAKINKYEVYNVKIYPFGGITNIHKELNSNLNKDLLLAMGGFIFQSIVYLIVLIFYKNNILTAHTFDLYKTYNFAILFFNFLPIYPLDGYNFFNNILNRFFSFQLAYKISVFISLIFIVILIFISYKNTLNIIMILSFLVFKIVKLIKNKSMMINKFFVERYTNTYTFSKIINNKSKNLNSLRINRFHYFYRNGHWNSEKTLLEEKYKQ